MDSHVVINLHRKGLFFGTVSSPREEQHLEKLATLCFQNNLVMKTVTVYLRSYIIKVLRLLRQSRQLSRAVCYCIMHKCSDLGVCLGIR